MIKTLFLALALIFSGSIISAQIKSDRQIVCSILHTKQTDKQ